MSTDFLNCLALLSVCIIVVSVLCCFASFTSISAFNNLVVHCDFKFADVQISKGFEDNLS